MDFPSCSWEAKKINVPSLASENSVVSKIPYYIISITACDHINHTWCEVSYELSATALFSHKTTEGEAEHLKFRTICHEFSVPEALEMCSTARRNKVSVFKELQGQKPGNIQVLLKWTAYWKGLFPFFVKCLC